MATRVSRREVLNDGFIMSPKNDFVFKLLFGDEKNKDLLIELLNDVLEIHYLELPKLFDDNVPKDALNILSNIK